MSRNVGICIKELSLIVMKLNRIKRKDVSVYELNCCNSFKDDCFFANQKLKSIRDNKG